MRVLQVFESLNVGGAQNFIMNIYRNIDRKKIQFDFLVHNEGFFDEEVIKMGGKIYYLKYISEIGPYQYKKELQKFLEMHNEYKIIHSHVNKTSGVILNVAKKCNIPLRISHSHSTNDSGNILVKIYKAYLKNILNKSANFKIACSKEAGEWLYGDSEYIIIKNAIEIKKFKYDEIKRNALRKKMNIGSKDVVIGHVGRFSTVKNHEFLLKIFKEYLTKNSNSFLILIGDGELKQEIERMSETMGIRNKIKFLGNIENPSDYYNVMDIFIMPSLYEGIPLTLIEAQVNGIQILASDTISRECDISKTIMFCSLDNVFEWVSKIKKYERKHNIKEIIDSGYDLKLQIELLQKIYTTLDRREK